MQTSKAPKAAGLPKLTKPDTVKPTGPSQPLKPHALKLAGVSKFRKPIAKGGTASRLEAAKKTEGTTIQYSIR